MPVNRNHRSNVRRSYCIHQRFASTKQMFEALPDIDSEGIDKHDVQHYHLFVM